METRTDKFRDYRDKTKMAGSVEELACMELDKCNNKLEELSNLLGELEAELHIREESDRIAKKFDEKFGNPFEELDNLIGEFKKW